MYILALINLVAIVLILILYKAFGLQNEETQKEKRPRHEEKEPMARAYHQEVSNIRKFGKQNGSILTLLAVLFGAMIYILLI